jgi:Cof subfamily protein (haloacid dehalogenase superfamily)
VHERDKKAVAALIDRGVHVSICTGRMYSGTREIARSIGVDGPVGCLDGSQVVHAGDDSTLASHPIAKDLTEPIRQTLREFDPVTFLFSDDTILHDGRGDPYLSFVGLWSKRALRLGNVLDSDHFREDRTVAALVSLGDQNQIRGAASRLLESLADQVQIGLFNVRPRDTEAPWGMVVRAAGVSKATALARIAEHYGVSIEETVAVGDWVNDISMLRAAGRSFAMAQAPDEVVASATDVLEADAVAGGGIEEAALRAGLL